MWTTTRELAGRENTNKRLSKTSVQHTTATAWAQHIRACRCTHSRETVAGKEKQQQQKSSHDLELRWGRWNAFASALFKPRFRNSVVAGRERKHALAIFVTLSVHVREVKKQQRLMCPKWVERHKEEQLKKKCGSRKCQQTNPAVMSAGLNSHRSDQKVLWECRMLA